MRVLSPKMLPCETLLVGSTARTATFFPRFARCIPKTSIKLLFPTPGTPVMPILTDLWECGKQLSIIFEALVLCSCWVLSTRVIALHRALLFQAIICATISSTVISFFLRNFIFCKESGFTWGELGVLCDLLRADGLVDLAKLKLIFKTYL